MKLTRTNRIIIVVAGLVIVGLLLFPPIEITTQVKRRGRGDWVERERDKKLRWIGTRQETWKETKTLTLGFRSGKEWPLGSRTFRYRSLVRIDAVQWAAEIAAVVILAGALLVLLGIRPKPKQDLDKSG